MLYQKFCKLFKTHKNLILLDSIIKAYNDILFLLYDLFFIKFKIFEVNRKKALWTSLISKYYAVPILSLIALKLSSSKDTVCRHLHKFNKTNKCGQEILRKLNEMQKN